MINPGAQEDNKSPSRRLEYQGNCVVFKYATIWIVPQRTDALPGIGWKLPFRPAHILWRVARLIMVGATRFVMKLHHATAKIAFTSVNGVALMTALIDIFGPPLKMVLNSILRAVESAVDGVSGTPFQNARFLPTQIPSATRPGRLFARLIDALADAERQAAAEADLDVMVSAAGTIIPTPRTKRRR